MINRKLNTTPLLPSEVIPGTEFRMGIETYVVTYVEGELYTVERLQRDFIFPYVEAPTVAKDIEDYESHVVPLPRLRPIDLWNYNNVLTDYLLKSLDFIAEPLGIYRRLVGEYEVVVKDSFYLEDCARLIVKGASIQVWYFHELQGAIYDTTGQMILTPMGKRLMLTRKQLP